MVVATAAGRCGLPGGRFLLVLPVAAGRQEWRHSGNGGGPRTRSREPESIIINNFNEAAKSHSMLAVVNGAGKGTLWSLICGALNSKIFLGPATPQEIILQETTVQETLPQEITVQETTVQETTVQETTTKNVLLKKLLPKKLPTKKFLGKKPLGKKLLGKKLLPKKLLDKKLLPKDDIGQETTSPAMEIEQPAISANARAAADMENTLWITCKS
ncbi:hypothetical protein DUI87_26581 [Hirundo rustica rustica]|uniref:Uncharacterized protein n=1 Tax=Hirundo rustica rustica TaxID=333673 RepID=A0A3M0J6M7_HIRRU|nr:hypothetical protein DUI87_26581 [Hirundo rustica rustica]